MPHSLPCHPLALSLALLFTTFYTSCFVFFFLFAGCWRLVADSFAVSLATALLDAAIVGPPPVGSSLLMQFLEAWTLIFMLI